MNKNCTPPPPIKNNIPTYIIICFLFRASIIDSKTTELFIDYLRIVESLCSVASYFNTHTNSNLQSLRVTHTFILFQIMKNEYFFVYLNGCHWVQITEYITIIISINIWQIIIIKYETRNNCDT